MRAHPLKRMRIAHWHRCKVAVRCPDGYWTTQEVTEQAEARFSKESWWNRLKRYRTPYMWIVHRPGTKNNPAVHFHKQSYVPLPIVDYLRLVDRWGWIGRDRVVPAREIQRCFRGRLGERLFAVKAVELNLRALLRVMPQKSFALKRELHQEADRLAVELKLVIDLLRFYHLRTGSRRHKRPLYGEVKAAEKRQKFWNEVKDGSRGGTEEPQRSTATSLSTMSQASSTSGGRDVGDSVDAVHQTQSPQSE